MLSRPPDGRFFLPPALRESQSQRPSPSEPRGSTRKETKTARKNPPFSTILFKPGFRTGFFETRNLNPVFGSPFSSQLLRPKKARSHGSPGAYSSLAPRARHENRKLLSGLSAATAIS